MAEEAWARENAVAAGGAGLPAAAAARAVFAASARRLMGGGGTGTTGTSGVAPQSTLASSLNALKNSSVGSVDFLLPSSGEATRPKTQLQHARAVAARVRTGSVVINGSSGYGSGGGSGGGSIHADRTPFVPLTQNRIRAPSLPSTRSTSSSPPFTITNQTSKLAAVGAGAGVFSTTSPAHPRTRTRSISGLGAGTSPLSAIRVSSLQSTPSASPVLEGIASADHHFSFRDAISQDATTSTLLRLISLSRVRAASSEGRGGSRGGGGGDMSPVPLPPLAEASETVTAASSSGLAVSESETAAATATDITPSITFSKQLPPAWRLVTEANGEIYYFNTVSGESRWTIPNPDGDGVVVVVVEK